MLQPTDAQRRRLERFGAAECVDIHCHVLPGLDDGPRTPEESLALCRALAEDGITTVVATPHQLGRYDRQNSGPAVRLAVATLRASLAAAGVPLKLRAGADVRLDERILSLLGSGEVLTVGGGPYLLLELPHETYIEPTPVIRMLGGRGVRVIVTHPERHEVVRAKPQLVGPWLQAGAMLQLTAGSLVGAFGSKAEAAAWRWLGAGNASFVATDAHDVSRRPPCMTAAMEAIERRLGADVARRVCVDNPAKVLPPMVVKSSPRGAATAQAAARAQAATPTAAEVAREA
jgi:protein-tyrosine phosphatase